MHAYFPALNSYPSLLGDMLADGINCLGFTWVMNYFKNIIKKLNTYTQGRQTSHCTTCTACFLASKYPKIPGLEASKYQNTLKFLASKPRAFSLDWRPCIYIMIKVKRALKIKIVKCFLILLLQASSPACTELETIVMDWLGKMIGLPEEFLHTKPHRSQSFTSLMADLRQDIRGVFSFSRCLNEHFLEGIALLRHWYINPNEKSNKYQFSLLC